MQNTPSAIDLAGSSDESLRDLVADEITGDGSLSPEVAAAILAAFPEAADAESGSGGVLAGMFLRSIAVHGFRGIGPRAVLNLEPAPGLTLIESELLLRAFGRDELFVDHALTQAALTQDPADPSDARGLDRLPADLRACGGCYRCRCS